MKPILSALSREHIVASIPEEDVVDKQRFVLFRIFSISGALVLFGSGI
ncbi:MAG: hypothetical protein IPK10_03930 [Bacteroidetes bacterium]|nr:hypothetical protein [Bacteroidota bacterium]